MFTGLVEDTGKISRATPRGESTELEITPTTLPVAELTLGESVAIDGVCLTVTSTTANSFRVLAAAETLARTTIGRLSPGSRVNLERALRVGDRLGGHMVAGHVDGVGEVTSRRPVGPSIEIEIRAPKEQARYIVEKGSITVDGISLTVNRVSGISFAVLVIPHTLTATTLDGKAVGARVNLEVDMVGKYIERFVKERLGAL
jgi:riboflavin synthase